MLEYRAPPIVLHDIQGGSEIYCDVSAGISVTHARQIATLALVKHWGEKQEMVSNIQRSFPGSLLVKV